MVSLCPNVVLASDLWILSLCAQIIVLCDSCVVNATHEVYVLSMVTEVLCVRVLGRGLLAWSELYFKSVCCEISMHCTQAGLVNIVLYCISTCVCILVSICECHVTSIRSYMSLCICSDWDVGMPLSMIICIVLCNVLQYILEAYAILYTEPNLNTVQFCNMYTCISLS